MYLQMTKEMSTVDSSANNIALFDQTIVGAISRELHKTAQPLTILQGLLELMQVTAPNEADRKSALARAVDEVHRLTSCFEDVRKLVSLQRPARDIATFPVSMLVSDVVQNLKSDLAAAGVTVVLNVQANDQVGSTVVNISQSRLFHATRLVLQTLSSSLRAKDRIAISIASDGQRVTIHFDASRGPRHEGCLTADRVLDNSQLEFSQVMLTSLGGELRWKEVVDSIVISLPVRVSQAPVPDQQWEVMHV
jgi:hypothetical protein